LDEKELVLHQEDTSNILSAIKLTREMLNTIDLNAMSAGSGFGLLTPTSYRDDNG
jgi:hypothetical protein